MTELSIVPECYVDTRIAEIVGQASRKYNHQHGCGDVANRMKHTLKDKIALGIVDEDKNKGISAKYFYEFTIVQSVNNLILKKHTEREHYLILICPEVEQWLLNDALTVNLKPEDYNLPQQMKGFKSITKSKEIDKNNDFYRFVKALINLNAPSISTLKTWIILFKSGELQSLIGK
jgi:hypothetical protein